MLIDLHTHSRLCGHGTGEIEAYIIAAIERGLVEIGISEHLPMYFLPQERRDPSVAMDEAMLPRYVEQVQELAQKYRAQITVRLGIEADFIPGQEEALAELLEPYHWDYVIGSIHFLQGWGFDDSRQIDGYQRRNLFELYQQYFDTVVAAAQSGLFDILGHLDLIKKFGFRPEENLQELYERVTNVLASFDQCIEINSAGWRYPAKEQYPQTDLIALCQAKGVPITLGSDAHSPADVGKDFARITQLLGSLGITQLTTFSQRKRMCIRIST